MKLARVDRRPMRSPLSQLMEDFFSDGLTHWGQNNFASENATLPKVNVRETENEYIIDLAAPGMKKDDFKVNLDNDLLTISSEREEKNEAKEEGSYTRREYSYTSFQRAFNLPQSADADKIKARYKDGILCLTIPKKEEAKPKPPKSISIS